MFVQVIRKIIMLVKYEASNVTVGYSIKNAFVLNLSDLPS